MAGYGVVGGFGMVRTAFDMMVSADGLHAAATARHVTDSAIAIFYGSDCTLEESECYS